MKHDFLLFLAKHSTLISMFVHSNEVDISCRVKPCVHYGAHKTHGRMMR